MIVAKSACNLSRVTISFRMNTYISVSKQMTLSCFRMNTYEKTRGEGLLWLTRNFRLRLQCEAALLAGAGATSTPKSHTYRFSPSSRISAKAYSPGGNGALSVNR